MVVIFDDKFLFAAERNIHEYTRSGEANMHLILTTMSGCFPARNPRAWKVAEGLSHGRPARYKRGFLRNRTCEKLSIRDRAESIVYLSLVCCLQLTPGAHQSRS